LSSIHELESKNFLFDMTVSHNSHPSVSTTFTAYTAESGSDSALSGLSRCPDIILELSSQLIASGPRSVPELAARLDSLALPIKAIDFSPQTEWAIASSANGIQVGTKIRTIGSNLGAGKGELRAGNIRQSVQQSLHTTGASRLNYIIAQRPDVEVSVGELAGSFGGLVSEGTVESVSFLMHLHKKKTNRFYLVGNETIFLPRRQQHPKDLSKTGIP
jgi:hypothetical protein